eukprot:m.233750 g.233750  ORF g.233750 m.233750 type:complete len:67 (+) comp40098_c0_seq17:215-415(+)
MVHSATHGSMHNDHVFRIFTRKECTNDLKLCFSPPQSSEMDAVQYNISLFWYTNVSLFPTSKCLLP